MRSFSWVAQESMRLATFLRLQLPGTSKLILQEAIRYHGCRVNGRVERFESYKIQKGDQISLFLRKKEDPLLLLDTPYFCIYDKPAYCVSETLASHLNGHLVHRLDRDTTGCFLLAKTKPSAESLIELFRQRKVRKQYLALVFGIPRHSEGEIVTYTAPKMRRCGAVLYGNTSKHKGKLTITRWRALEHHGNLTLMQCRPITGRTHQIRLHMHSIGHPIVGDIDYGRKHQPRGVFHPLLHAQSIHFTFHDEPVSATALSRGDPKEVAPHLFRLQLTRRHSSQ